VVYGKGEKFYYAGDEGSDAYKTDTIATRGFVKCAPETAKVAAALGQSGPLRLSQKPVTLLEYFVTSLVRVHACMLRELYRDRANSRYADVRAHVQVPPNFLIIDPFCGTGSVGEAALRCGRAYLGCDVDPVAVRASTERLKEIENGLKAGTYPDERKFSQVRELYVSGAVVHHSAEVPHAAPRAREQGSRTRSLARVRACTRRPRRRASGLCRRPRRPAKRSSQAGSSAIRRNVAFSAAPLRGV
jgi:hypothetical protein